MQLKGRSIFSRLLRLSLSSSKDNRKGIMMSSQMIMNMQIKSQQILTLHSDDMMKRSLLLSSFFIYAIYLLRILENSFLFFLWVNNFFRNLKHFYTESKNPTFLLTFFFIIAFKLINFFIGDFSTCYVFKFSPGS